MINFNAQGDWADDNESCWSRVSQKTRESLLKQDDDGEFWISFEDFIKHFGGLRLAHLTPDTIADIMFAPNPDTILDRDRFKWQEESSVQE